VSEPVNRPTTARPRAGAASAAADQEPPTDDERLAIERGLVELTRYSSAVIREEPELGVVLAILHGRGPGYNFAACPRWPEAEVGDRLARLEQVMHEEGEWPALMVADGVSQPADLTDRLGPAGWVEIERELIMWTREPPGVPHLDPLLRLEAVTSRTAADYERVEREIFGLGEDFAAQRTAGLSYSLSAGWLRAYLVRLNGEPVATARLALGEGTGYIFGVGVVAEQRRRGLGSLVTAVATRAALAGGNRLVWLSVNELNDAALGVYRRLGFQPGLSWSRWVVSSG
jgi:ribosomal protein S18 acetylase RimI-like enzyme